MESGEPRLPVVRCSAWLDGSRGWSLDCNITRITGRNVNTRSIVEGVKLIFAVVTLRKVKRTAVAWVSCLIAGTPGPAQPTSPTVIAVTSKHGVEKYRHRDANHHGEYPAKRGCNEQIWREENQHPFGKAFLSSGAHRLTRIRSATATGSERQSN